MQSNPQVRMVSFRCFIGCSLPQTLLKSRRRYVLNGYTQAVRNTCISATKESFHFSGHTDSHILPYPPLKKIPISTFELGMLLCIKHLILVGREQKEKNENKVQKLIVIKKRLLFKPY